MTALEERFLPGRSPADRWSPGRGTLHFSGVQAVVRVVVDVLREDRAGGLRTAAFVSGYQGSPLAGFDRELQKAIRQGIDVEVVHRPAVNEELGATAVMGSQLASTMASARLDGVVGVWYGKAPGLDRSADALRHASWAGASRHGGAVALVGDDPGAKSSTLPSASEQLLADLAMPVLFPRSLSDVLELGRHAVALSRWSGAWVACKLVTSVADAEGTVVVAEPAPIVLPDGWEASRVTGELITPATLVRERDVAERRLDAAARYGDANALNRLTVDPGRASLAIVAAGTVFSELVEALRLLGLDEERLAALGVRLAEVRMPFPLGAAFCERLGAGVDEVIVVEERRDLLEHQILSFLGRRRGGPAIVGRRDEYGAPFVPRHGTLGATALARLLQPRLAARFGHAVRPAPRERVAIPVTGAAERVPWFCSGCPHSASTRVPEGTLVGAGIGCHSIVTFMPEKRVGRVVGLTQMGGEGAQWIGLAPFVNERHLVQNLGDGTFFHSGHLAVRAALAAGVPITFKILWNGASAMTGGQAVEGATASPLALAELLRVEGVERVVITTDDLRRYRRRRLPAGISVRPRSALLAVQEDLAAVNGVTVLIHDQACATELRRARKRGLAPTPRQKVVINERVCEGCGDCQVKSNCLSLQTVPTAFGPKTCVDTGTCNVDLACLDGDCPAFTLVDVDGPAAKAAERLAPAEAAVPDDLAAPPRAEGPVTVRIAGIGGTGVVTAAHLLAWAAMLDGLEVWGLDQTGLSQKAGAVVSDLRIGAGATARSNVIREGEADLLLAADLMAAARPSVLYATSAQRTAVVGSTSAVLSGPMVLGALDRAVPVDDLRSSVAGSCRPGGAFLDADAVAGRWAGTAAVANVVLLGVAAQRGLLPVAPESIEAAIGHNAVAVTANLAAFRAGRAWAASILTAEGNHGVETTPTSAARAVSAASAASGVTPAAGASADRLEAIIAGVELPAAHRSDIAGLAGDLVGYQSPRLARRFLSLLGETWTAERAAGGDGELTAAVGFGYHKLLAAKDEYEVARLLLDHPGSSGRTTWLLHPPLLRALGLSRKIRLGPWATPAMAALRAGRRLRGTPLDPFGRTALRRQERKLPLEYAAGIHALLGTLDAASLPAAAEVARFPDRVRGYEDVKVRSIAAYRRDLDAALAAFPPRAGADD